MKDKKKNPTLYPVGSREQECVNCKFHGTAAFDSKCPQCGESMTKTESQVVPVTFYKGGNTMNESNLCSNSECGATLHESMNFCTSCGNEATSVNESSDMWCNYCSKKLQEHELNCSRCGTSVYDVSESTESVNEGSVEDSCEIGSACPSCGCTSDSSSSSCSVCGMSNSPMSNEEADVELLTSLAFQVQEDTGVDVTKYVANHIIFGEDTEVLPISNIANNPLKWVPENLSSTWHKVVTESNATTYMDAAHLFKHHLLNR
jgi:DNA-directed RNA polymerase subunit RPC12/RpoP